MDRNQNLSKEELISWGLSTALEACQAGDFKTAIKFWIAMAEKGNIEAQNNLGKLYGSNLDFADENGGFDTKEAIRWFKLSAEQGNVAAQNELGLLFKYMYRSDKPFLTSRHVTKAIKWFTSAANKGHAEARFNLGQMYSEGRTVKQDLKITFYWWTLAAEQGHAKAQNHLGGMYENGHGVPMNGEIAVKWYTSSAKLGLNIAQFNLAWSFQYGLGGVKNYKNAYVWYLFAASNFHPDGYKKLVQLKNEMTADEISNAKIELELEKARGTLYGENKLLGFD